MTRIDRKVSTRCNDPLMLQLAMRSGAPLFISARRLRLPQAGGGRFIESFACWLHSQPAAWPNPQAANMPA